ncbi:MAG: 3-methyl-2-oxobutanoate hydroxymethyltransferase [Gemmataceae bacterium]|nr:3-methyl-2-oxobutanoate hydroxymethyltransferase [Gemmataceae bacterium]
MTDSQKKHPGKAVTVPDFSAAKAQGRKLVMVTAYDYPMARLADEAGVDALLVGDSLGMVVQGRKNPLAVTLGQMIYHAEMVSRGASRALVVVDLPFMSYQESSRQGVRSAGKILKRTGAKAVKLEGGVRMEATIRAITDAGIPVMAHIGLTPQAVHQLGGFKVQRDREQILQDARAVEAAGAFALVVECVPAALAQEVTAAVKIPTIGIGAGPNCDGQILVAHDLLELTQGKYPSFSKSYASVGSAIVNAFSSYAQEVRSGKFPSAEHSLK